MDALPSEDMRIAQKYWSRECGALEFTVMGLTLEMSAPRAGSSAGSGGDLPSAGPDRDGDLPISYFLLRFLLEPCTKKARACPVTKTKLSSSRFPSLFKGNQHQSCISSCKPLSEASLCCQCEVCPCAEGILQPTDMQSPH